MLDLRPRNARTSREHVMVKMLGEGRLAARLWNMNATKRHLGFDECRRGGFNDPTRTIALRNGPAIPQLFDATRTGAAAVRKPLFDAAKRALAETEAPQCRACCFRDEWPERSKRPRRT